MITLQEVGVGFRVDKCNAGDLINIIQAFQRGRTIQALNPHSGQWQDLECGAFLMNPGWTYRVKPPEKEYVAHHPGVGGTPKTFKTIDDAFAYIRDRITESYFVIEEREVAQ